MNITQHALMRMLQRQFDEYIINDSTFQAWKRANPDGVPKAEKEIHRIYTEAEHIIICPDSKNTIKKFKINTKDMWIIVYDDVAIITIYPIEYSKKLNEEANREIINIMLKEYNNQYSSFIIERTEVEPRIEEIDKSIDVIAAEIKTLKNKIDFYESEIKKKQAEKDVTTKRINMLKQELDCLGLKVVQPISLI